MDAHFPRIIAPAGVDMVSLTIIIKGSGDGLWR